MIARDPVTASSHDYDLVIVGGGIYGACLALEAARRALRPLLLERGDFGEATSWNSLRILHGGLRYLQTLDLRRFRDSVNERRWFCRTFPDLIQPQACLMPLYGDGLKRPSVFGAALLVNDLLSLGRNAGVDSANRIARGTILSADEVVARFPLVDRCGLRGGALWHDATMVNSQRVLIEILHWACSLGATALNYVEATELEVRAGVVTAVHARDTLAGRSYTFGARALCNCAGPWSAQVAGRFDRPMPALFRPSLAFNVLLDRDPPSGAAVAVAPRRDGKAAGPVYFLYPAFGRLLAGTVHVPWRAGAERPQPDAQQIQHFLAELNMAVPGLNVQPESVVRVFVGLLPVVTDGTAKLSVRPRIHDHSQTGGPRGLVSVAGVKFTTARLVADHTLRTLQSHFGAMTVRDDTARPRQPRGIDFNNPPTGPFGPEQTALLQQIVQEEAVMSLEDLLYRRTNWAIAERDMGALRRSVSDVLGGRNDEQYAPGCSPGERSAAVVGARA